MTRIPSKTAPNAVTSDIDLPFEPVYVKSVTAAVMRFFVPMVERRSWKKASMLAESAEETMLPSLPLRPGYSQSMSIPSSW